MSSIIQEPLVIGYTCCGPTYRKSVYDKIKDYYFDDDNLYYCILTDDKSYFSDLTRKNLIVNELKDFYSEFPDLEKNEYFLESTNEQEYADNFIQTNYLFPFSRIPQSFFIKTIYLNLLKSNRFLLSENDQLLHFDYLLQAF